MGGGDPLFAQAVRGSSAAPRVPEGQVLAHYRSLREAGVLGRYLVVEYRCADRAGCVLARVFTTPSGTFVYQPPHTYRVSAGASPGAVRVAAGHRVRVETVVVLPPASEAVELSCDHLSVRRDVEAVLGDIGLAHRRGCPTGRRIDR